MNLSRGPESAGKAELEARNEALQARLEEVEETLNAIRGGEVDALLIGEQIYTLESADAASNRFRGEALAQINEVVIAVDNDLNVIYLNPAAERQYGVDASSVLGLKLSELYTYKWADPDAEKSSRHALETVGTWRGENLHVTRTGEEIRVESSVSRLFDRDGQPVGYMAIIRDIRERKLAEEALREAHDELEVRVRERTKELANASKNLEKEMLERAAAERQRSELLQRVVTIQEEERRRIALEIHDQLGQRVTALRFQIASLLNDFAHPGELSKRLKILDDTALKLDSEVSFLTWELRPRSLDDLGLAEAVRNFLDDWQTHHGIRVAFDAQGYAPDHLSLQSETHLYRILQEALNNILKHAHASNVGVILSYRGDDVQMIVEDDGDGFDTHESADPSPKGLGLTGMKERAILMGGSVQIESSPGYGCTIHVRVPSMAARPSAKVNPSG